MTNANANANADTGLSLSITHTFNADRERVWQAWTTPTQLTRWFHPGPNFSCSVHQFDLEVGGAYRITMTDSEASKDHTAHGEFREIVPGEKLTFSWQWEEGENPLTLVSIELRDNGERTDLTLTHSGFRDQQTCDHHEQGWTGICDSLHQEID